MTDAIECQKLRFWIYGDDGSTDNTIEIPGLGKRAIV
jgi:hypothetical protein